MKKLCLALVLVLVMASSVCAKDTKPLLNYTADNIFSALEKYSSDTDFLFDASAAQTSCDIACTLSASIDENSNILVTYDKESKRVTSVNFLIQLVYDNQEKTAMAMLRCVNAVEVITRLIDPKVAKSTKEKIHKRVGILANGFLEGKEGTATFKGVKLESKFINGVYFINAHTAQ